MRVKRSVTTKLVERVVFVARLVTVSPNGGNAMERMTAVMEAMKDSVKRTTRLVLVNSLHAVMVSPLIWRFTFSSCKGVHFCPTHRFIKFFKRVGLVFSIAAFEARPGQCFTPPRSIDGYRYKSINGYRRSTKLCVGGVESILVVALSPLCFKVSTT